MGFVVANAGLVAGKEVFIWLSLDGVFLSQQSYVDGIHMEGFKPLSELIASFVDNGGQMIVCPPCFKSRELDEAKLVKNAALARMLVWLKSFHRTRRVFPTKGA